MTNRIVPALRFAAMLASAIALAGAAQAGSAADNAADIEAVKEANRRILEANNRADASGVETYARDELLVLAPGGRLEHKQQVIDGVGAVQGALALTGEEVVIVGDTAVHVGKLSGDAVMEPLGKLPPMKVMSTFVRTDEGWRLLGRALVPCAKVAVERGVC